MESIRDILKRIGPLRDAVRLIRLHSRGAIARIRPGLSRSDAARIDALRNIHEGKRCWVVGNGPSLTKLDLSLLNGEITFCCNGIWLLFDRIAWRPSYYFVEDRLVARDDAHVISKLGGMTKFFPRDLRHILLPDENTIYVNFVRGEYPGFPRFSTRPGRVVYWGQTVTYMMLQFAHWMGCSPIYLIGQDMHYELPEQVDGNEITSIGIDVNHFHPDYFGCGKHWHVPDVEGMLHCLKCAGRRLSKHNQQVYNATGGGNLGVFPRVVFEDVFR